DVVVRHIFRRESGGNEVRLLGIAGTALRVNGIEQTIFRELRMKNETDESALQTVIDGKRKHLRNVCINVRLIVRIDEIQKATRIVGEPSAIGKATDVGDGRPTCWGHVLIGWTNSARVRKTDDILKLHLKAVFRNRRRNWITGDRVVADLRLDGTDSPDRN